MVSSDYWQIVFQIIQFSIGITALIHMSCPDIKIFLSPYLNSLAGNFFRCSILNPVGYCVMRKSVSECISSITNTFLRKEL